MYIINNYVYCDYGGGSSLREKIELSLGHVKIKMLRTLWLYPLLTRYPI